MPSDDNRSEPPGSNLRIEDARIFPAQSTWDSSVGNFILGFGAMELDLLAFLSRHLSDDDFDKVRDLHFKDRVSRTLAIVKEGGFSKEVQNDFARLAKAIEPLREIRNHLAHAHMTIIQDDDMATGLKASRMTLSLPKDFDRPFDSETWHMTFEELNDARQRLYQLAGAVERITRDCSPENREA